MCEEKQILNVKEASFLFVGYDSNGQYKTWMCSPSEKKDTRWRMFWSLERARNTVDFVDDGEKCIPIKKWAKAPGVKGLPQWKVFGLKLYVALTAHRRYTFISDSL